MVIIVLQFDKKSNNTPDADYFITYPTTSTYLPIVTQKSREGACPHAPQKWEGACPHAPLTYQSIVNVT